MGAEVLKEFLVRLGFQVDEAGMKKFNSGLISSTTRLAAFSAGIQAAAGLIYAGIWKIAENSAALLSLSEELGVTVGRLKELNFVASLTGSSADALKSSLQGLQSAMAGALIGGGGLATFARLGIRIKDANGHLRDTTEVLMEIGEKIKKMDRPKAQMFLGQLGIDKSLYKMLTQDISGVTAAYREMYAATGMDAQKAAEQSRGFVQEVKMLKAVLGLLAESVNIALISKFGPNVTAMRKTVMDNFGKITRSLQAFLGLILRIAGFVGAMVTRVVQWASTFIDWFSRLDGTIQTIVLGIVGFAAAWRWLNLSFLMTPLGMIITGIIALAAVVDDFMTYLEGGESLLDWGPWASSIMTVWNVVSGFLSFTMDGLRTLAGLVLTVWQPWVDLIASLWEPTKAFLSFVVDGIKSVFDLIGKIGSGISAVVNLFGGKKEGGDSAAPPILGPSPAFAAATAGVGGGGKTELTANANIYIDGAGDPEAVGRSVGGQQQRVNADLVRNTRGAAR
jgi:hypothetical protein